MKAEDEEIVGCVEDAHSPPAHPPIDAKTLERAAAIFRAAGDPGRLRILYCLLCGEHCVTDLANDSGEGMSTISQRLKVLRSEGLVSRRREGKHIFYGLADDHVAELVRGALDHASHE
ncbi:MAG: metalloregulator ArsR/SmtB family transcription factor [Myxococcota bacterium]